MQEMNVKYALFWHLSNKKPAFLQVLWSWWPDSNWRPHPYQGCALPTELHQQVPQRQRWYNTRFKQKMQALFWNFFIFFFRTVLCGGLSRMGKEKTFCHASPDVGLRSSFARLQAATETVGKAYGGDSSPMILPERSRIRTAFLFGTNGQRYYLTTEGLEARTPRKHLTHGRKQGKRYPQTVTSSGRKIPQRMNCTILNFLSYFIGGK